jgi:DNA-binding beta-propeller fold protein YncE
MKRFLLIGVLLLAVVAAVPTQGFAASFSVGDIFASIGGGAVQHYSSAGVLLNTLTMGVGFTTGSTTDSAGDLYVTNFSENQVYKFINGGSNAGSVWISAADMPGTASAESILFDAAGNAYVGHADGNGDITKHASAGGAATAAYNVLTTARGSDWIDLAADQTTMYYTSENFEIKRYDLSTDTQLADFTAGVGTRPLYALRILSDGGVMVADQNNGLRRYDSTGALVTTYSVGPNPGGWFALNLDPDGTSVWGGSFNNGTLYKFDIASGAVLQTVATGSGSLFGVSVYGEITQSGGGVGVPEPTSLLLLGTGLLGLALKRKAWGSKA